MACGEVKTCSPGLSGVPVALQLSPTCALPVGSRHVKCSDWKIYTEEALGESRAVIQLFSLKKKKKETEAAHHLLAFDQIITNRITNRKGFNWK